MLANVYVEGNQVKIRGWFVTPHTIGRCDAGSNLVTVADPDGLSVSDPVVLEGAGPEGTHLVTTVSAINGSVVTIATAATTAVKWVVVGKLTDPTTITFRVKKPDGTTESFAVPHSQITSPQDGVFVLTYDPAASGTYWYDVKGTGTAKGAAQGSFNVADGEID